MAFLPCRVCDAIPQPSAIVLSDTLTTGFGYVSRTTRVRERRATAGDRPSSERDPQRYGIRMARADSISHVGEGGRTSRATILAFHTRKWVRVWDVAPATRCCRRGGVDAQGGGGGEAYVG